ncbi:MAG: hypothetical protein K9N21_05075 [Deltaproteobacteria bacterium]|nr:hypothetical protein [Deltaproteobacteria bacterium]
MVDKSVNGTGEVMDLGVGGCLLGITADLKPGTAFSLRFVLGSADAGPESIPMKYRAKLTSMT